MSIFLETSDLQQPGIRAAASQAKGMFTQTTPIDVPQLQGEQLQLLRSICLVGIREKGALSELLFGLWALIHEECHEV